MLTRIWQTYKRQCVIGGIALAVILILVYFYFLFQTGIWYNDVFLVRQTDGSFQGAKDDARFTLDITRTDNGAQIAFSVNDETRQYEVVQTEMNDHPAAQFYEDGALVYEGLALDHGASGRSYLIADEDFNLIDGLLVQSTWQKTRPAEEWFPGYSAQYRWTVIAQEDAYDIRGNPAILVLAIIPAVFLGLDLRYPDLAFELRYRRYVDGDCEPNAYYRFWQKIGRVILAILIAVCLVMGLISRVG